MRTLWLRAFGWISRGGKVVGLHRLPALARMHSFLFGFVRTSNLVQVDGIDLRVDARDRVIGKKIALYGNYEECERHVLLSLAEPGTVVVDVGANVGLHTLPLARKLNGGGMVIAFEPDPDNCEILRRNVALNGFGGVEVHNVALWSDAGEALLYQSEVNRGGLSLSEANVESSGALEPVAIRKIPGDAVLGDLKDQISLIKMDVEGGEYFVLQGLEQTLARNPRAHIVLEFWPRYVRSFDLEPVEVLNWLERRGFTLGVIDDATGSIQESNATSITQLADKSSNALNVVATPQVGSAKLLNDLLRDPVVAEASLASLSVAHRH